MPDRILIAEDETAIADALEYALRAEGYEVDAVADGAEALDEARERSYDLLVLDLMLPTLPGMEVCRRLREQTAIPILMLTAKDAEVDRVLGLEVGADDYVTKPFSMAEVVARVRALLRRRELDRSDGGVKLVVGDLAVDLVRHQVTVAGRAVSLTTFELKLLALLAGEPERVYGEQFVGPTGTDWVFAESLRFPGDASSVRRPWGVATTLPHPDRSAAQHLFSTGWDV